MICVLAGDYDAYRSYCREHNLNNWRHDEAMPLTTVDQLRGQREPDLRFAHGWEHRFMYYLDELAVFKAFRDHLDADLSRLQRLTEVLTEERDRRQAIVSKHDRYISYLKSCAESGIIPPGLEELIEQDPQSKIDEQKAPLERIQQSLNWLSRYIREKVQ